MRIVAQVPISVGRLAIFWPHSDERGYNRGASGLAVTTEVVSVRCHRASRRAGSEPINGGSHRLRIWSTALMHRLVAWPGSAG